MGLVRKAVGAVGTVGKGLWHLGTRDNLTPTTGGGLTSAIIKRQVNALGFAGLTGAMTVGSLIKNGWEMNNRRTMGYTTFQDGLTRMTDSHGSDVIEVMKRSAQGDYGTFAELATPVMRSPGLGRIDDFGANPALIASLYHMGGR